jgi:hypothetical protein
MPTAEAMKCACGTQMDETENGLFVCDNCDFPQRQEYRSMERRKTPEDIRFDMYWLRKIKKELPGKAKQESNDDSEEPTGDEDNE